MTSVDERWVVEPFRMGDAEEFERLREVFGALEYTEPDVCKRLGIDTIHQATRRLEPNREVSDPQALLIRLFLETAEVPWRVVHALLAPGDLAAMEDLGLLMSQLSRDQFAALDMESRWEYCLRMRLFSGWQGTPLVLERYPQRF
jgi:hypothetical protein